MGPRAQRIAETPIAAGRPRERPDSAVSASLEFRLLGPLEIGRGGEALALGGARPRALLACLLLSRGRVVSVDELVHELWGESPPPTARHMVAVYVSKLRKLLGESVLLTRPPGYLLQSDRERVDVERFERLLGEGGEALACSDAARASASLAAALGLWRGPALADFTYEPFAQAEIARLEELRLVALEERIEADLALGQHAELVGELEALIAREPLRERLRCQLMLALYRAGRQTDALAAYRTARETLVEELGVEPGPELRRLEQAILAQEEWLTGPRGLPRRPIEIRETRKLLTVLFAEAAEDDPAAAEADLETLQPVARRWLQGAEDVLVRHGATVERLPDGTLMGIFGSPIAHEDDALRSLRAAAELRELGIVSRVGVDTGEALAGGDPLVSGPAIRAAARLLAIAPPGEVIIGDATHRLALSSGHFEPFASDGVGAWRLVDVVAGAPVRGLRLDALLVGRENELAELREAFTTAVHDRRPNLVTVIGEPGIGKTRLAREFGERAKGEASILTGRCLAYGEGITYWPLREILGEAVGEESTEALDALVKSLEESKEIARRLATAVGFLQEVYPVEEIRWAARRLFEALARERPLILVIDDVHWAEPTILDLVSHVVTRGRDAPILFVCLARSDISEEHPEWERLSESATRLVLEALTPAEAAELVSGLDSSGTLARDRREQVIGAAEGNPLFLEQLVAYAAETGRARGVLDIPPTLQALLAARLDSLGPGERAVLECAAVVGREFWAGAVGELLPKRARATLPRHLDALISKELIEPDTPTLPFDDAFRFRHVLIQEAAYRAVPKTRRSRLHERLALWLARQPGHPSEELVGYHFEQAYLYRAELRAVDEDGLALARSAAEYLAAAAQRALNRGDRPAQLNLLSRSLELLPPGDPARSELLPELGTTLTGMADFAKAEVVLVEAIHAAAAAGDARGGARARVVRAELRATTGAAGFPELRREAERAIRVLLESGDDLGLAKAWGLLAWLDHGQGQEVAAQEEWQRSIEHARRAGSRWDEIAGLEELAWVAVWGPTPRVEALRRCEQIREEVKGYPEFEAYILSALSCLRALEGSFDGARALYARRDAILNELGFEREAAWGSYAAGWVEMLAGNAAAAEGLLRAAYEKLAEMGATGSRQVVGSYLAQALCMQGRFEETERLALSVEQLDPTSAVEVAFTRCARAKAIAELGRVEEGERLASEAVALLDRTDFLIDRAHARMGLAEVLRLAGRSDEAAEVLEEALHLHEQKGNLVSAGRARASLAELGR